MSSNADKHALVLTILCCARRTHVMSRQRATRARTAHAGRAALAGVGSGGGGPGVRAVGGRAAGAQTAYQRPRRPPGRGRSATGPRVPSRVPRVPTQGPGGPTRGPLASPGRFVCKGRWGGTQRARGVGKGHSRP